jgi:8-oxo-dGTP diphosphatase
MDFGCFPEVASAREKAIKTACVGKSKKNFRNSNLDALGLWKEVKAKNRRSGRTMSDAIFVTAKAAGRLKIGDKKEIDKATWRKPRGIRLTPTSRYIRDKLFPKSN